MVAITHSNRGKFFGLDIGEFGLFASLLLSLSMGFLTFFAACFVSIIGILIYNSAGHHVNFADSYLYFGLPVGLGVLAISLVLFLGLWIRRKFSGN